MAEKKAGFQVTFGRKLKVVEIRLMRINKKELREQGVESPLNVAVFEEERNP